MGGKPGRGKGFRGSQIPHGRRPARPYATPGNRRGEAPLNPGWKIGALTRQAQAEPAVAADLASGAKQTVTGRPSGFGAH